MKTTVDTIITIPDSVKNIGSYAFNNCTSLSESVYELIASDTIEEQIQNIKKDKAKLMEDVLSGESVSASKIEREELLQLLGEL